MSLTLIKGGKEDEPKAEKPEWFKEHNKAKVRAMFQPSTTKWNQGLREGIGYVDNYPGKLGEAMEKHGSLRGNRAKPAKIEVVASPDDGEKLN